MASDIAAERHRSDAPIVPVAALLASGSSNQLGAALGAVAFSQVGPAGVVAVRQMVAAVVLSAISRPDLRKLTWHQWWPALLLGLVFATMNLSLYTAIDRIGLGLAITLEFLGPFAVALAGVRSVRMAFCALASGTGVAILIAPGPTTDWYGIGLALMAAVCWAAYILLNRVIGGRLEGLQGPAIASSASAVGYLPVLLVLVIGGRFDVSSAILCVAAGVLSSVVPYATDVIVLRRIRPAVFGIIMSLNPALAALAGLLVLGQSLTVWQTVAIAGIVAANIGAVTAPARPGRAAVQAGQRARRTSR